MELENSRADTGNLETCPRATMNSWCGEIHWYPKLSQAALCQHGHRRRRRRRRLVHLRPTEKACPERLTSPRATEYAPVKASTDRPEKPPPLRGIPTTTLKIQCPSIQKRTESLFSTGRKRSFWNGEFSGRRSIERSSQVGDSVCLPLIFLILDITLAWKLSSKFRLMVWK